MKRISRLVLAVALCLLFAVGVSGQTQRATGVRSVDAASTVSRPAEPDSPGSNATVTAGPQAVIPRLIKFSGALHDAAGKPLNGTVDVTFALYSTEAGGNPLWFETQSVQADELGRYTALLGAMHTDGLPIDLFTSGEVRWLGIQVGLEAEQQPRVLLVSVPYALKAGDAETLGGKPASAYMLSDSQEGTASTTSTVASTTGTAQTGTSGKNQKTGTANTSPLASCTNVATDGKATLNSIALFTGPCSIESSVLTQLSGNIGIGTTTPNYALQIVTNRAGNGIFLNAQTFGAGYFLARAGTLEGFFSVAGQAGGYSAVALGNDAVFGAQSAPSNGNLIFTTQNAAGNIKFATGSSALNDTTKMIVTNAGNVGIGTSTPGANLDVTGNVRVTANYGGPVCAGLIVSFNGPLGFGCNIAIVAAAHTGNGLAAFADTGTPLAAYASLGNTSPVAIFGYNGTTMARIDITGKGFFDGGTQTGGADFAESVAVRGNKSLYEPGDLLVIERGAHRQLMLSRTPYSTRVAGIYSTKPGVLATPHTMDDGHIKQEVPLAVVGIVPCKVTAQNGPIREGDLLVTSSRPGYAMKGTDRRRLVGAVVGKALEPLPSGKGVIQVLVTLQ